MDSFELNKIAGAVLASILFVLVVRTMSEAVFEVPPPARQAYVVEGVEAESSETAAAGAQPEAPPLPDFGTVIPAADAAAGLVVAQRCAQCHNWEKGGPNMIGPNLYGVIGRAKGAHEGFSYSAAMKRAGGEWTYADIYEYVRQPARFMPGNKMAFAGLPRSEDRINLLAAMRAWADSPAPLPPPAPAEAAPAEAPPAEAPAAPAEAPAEAPAPAQP